VSSGRNSLRMRAHLLPKQGAEDYEGPPEPEGRMGLAGFASVARRRRCARTSPSSSRLALASLPQPDLEVRSLRNAARQYPCARPSVLSPRAPDRAPARPAPRALFVDRVDAVLAAQNEVAGRHRGGGGEPVAGER